MAYAEDKLLINRIRGHLRRLLNYRRMYDRKWLYYYRQLLSYREPQYYPDNITKRSNVFIPYQWSNVDTTVGRLCDAFFGFEPNFETRGRGLLDFEAAERMDLVLKYKLHQAQWEGAFDLMARTGCTYGPMAWKVDWNFSSDIVMEKVPVPLTQMDETGQEVPILGIDGQPMISHYVPQPKRVYKNCPKIVPIDVFDLLIDPDGKYIGCMTEKTLGQLKDEAESWKALNPPEEGNPQQDLYFPEALEEIENRIQKSDDFEAEDVLIRIAELWDTQNNTCILITTQDDAEVIGLKDQRAAIRTSSYSAFRRPLFGGGEPVLLWAGPNPFMHKRCPILYTSYTKLQNEPLGVGVIEPAADLVDRLSRFAGMIEDNWNLGVNSRVAYDINKAIDKDQLNYMNVPGGNVAFDGPPGDALFPIPHFTPPAGDYQILALFKGMIEMTSGISDFYGKGLGSPTNNDTATGITSVIQEQSMKFRAAIRNIAYDIMMPTLEMCASNIQQFITDEEEFLISDAQPGLPKRVQVRPEELIGNYSFQFAATYYMTNRVLLQRNMLALANVVAENPYVSLPDFTRELFKVFQIPNLQRVLRDPQTVQQEMAAQQAQQLMLQEIQAEEESRRQKEQTVVAGVVGAAGKAAVAKAGPRPSRATGGKEGRPRRPQQPEGKIPGGGPTSVMRSMSQALGGNALGLEGLGEKSIGGLG